VKQILLGNGAGIGKNGRYKFFLMDEKPTVVPVSLIHGFSRYSGVKRLRHIEAQHGLLIASLL